MGYLATMGKIELKSTDKWVETDDSIFFEATVWTDHGEAHVYDVFILKDGKATHHYTGLISFTPFANQRSVRAAAARSEIVATSSSPR